jgi:hypothetical protein
MDQGLEHLPGKHEALRSNPLSLKKKIQYQFKNAHSLFPPQPVIFF